ncbi:MAG: heme lyase CcmF/NrfE family subunit [Actinomycetes bacterium]
MTGTLGAFGLALGLFATLAAAALWWRVAARDADAGPARQATWLALAGALIAFGALEWAMVAPDLSVAFAAENTSRTTPLYYRVTGLWSGLEGSLVLWLLVLTGYLAALARRAPRGATRLHPWAVAVVCAVAAVFFALTLLAASPFGTVEPVPADGPGPNPLLASHPAMGMHPPLLYLGYVGMVVPFAYAVAGLVVGDADASWVRVTRRWTLTAWVFLTCGIVLGAWWSYAVLGWGGYWAWDPVENASLLPWLTATALLHSTLLQRRVPTAPVWNVGLAGSTFLLVCTGTFLTRSGVVASVHSFTRSPLGPLLLGVLALFALVLLGLLIWRADRLRPPAPSEDDDTPARLADVASPRATPPRVTAVLLNNLLLVGFAAVLLIGTVFPVLAQSALGETVAVGAPYYDRIAVPVALALLVLLVLAPAAGWREPLPALVRRAAVPGVAAAAVVVVLVLAGARGASAVLTCGLGCAVLTAVARDLLPRGPNRGRRRTRRRVGGQLAHAGIALAAVAVAASGTWTTSAEQTVTVGEAVPTRAGVVHLVGVDRHATGAQMSVVATVAVLRGSGETRTVQPRLTFFPARQMTLSRPGIATGMVDDVYVTVLAVDDAGTSATLRVAVNPLVGLLWAAGLLTAVGGLVALLPLRRPTRRGTGVVRRATEHVP